MEALRQSYKIILAEDHIRFREIIKKIIEGNGELTVVGEANDGLELLELLEQSLPDMVIIDISMPKLRGLKAAKRVKELYPQIKMLAGEPPHSEKPTHHLLTYPLTAESGKNS
jgi:DNA-binding NarL/FixJ family response regulator